MLKSLFKSILGSNNTSTAEKSDPSKKIQLGHYSDNNKPPHKSDKWDASVELFKKQSFLEGIDTFFEYLKDDEINNVTLTRDNDKRQFSIVQGSKIVKGHYDAEVFDAQVRIAYMKTPFVPAMRYVLEQNFSFYYSRFALQDNMLCMRFNADTAAVNTSRLYYGLKELSNAADKYDTTLVKQFPTLEMVDVGHVLPIDAQQLEIKYNYFKQNITETLDYIKTLKQEEFSSGILYLLLCLAYRIDFLLSPEGMLLYDLQKLSRNYFSQKEEKTSLQQIREMITEFERLSNMSKEEFVENMQQVKRTFAINAPPGKAVFADMLKDSLANCKWYMDNNYPQIGQQILEYSLTYCQFTYSLPKILTEFIEVSMMIQHAKYFKDLGITNLLYNPDKKTFNNSAISQRIYAIIQKWRNKYPDLSFKTETLDYTNLLRFQYSFISACYNMGF